MSFPAPLAWWDCEEATAATRIDATGNGHNLANNGNVIQGSGKVDFGIDSINTTAGTYLELPSDILVGLSDVTIVYWANPATNDTAQQTFMGGYSFFLETNRFFFAGTGGNQDNNFGSSPYTLNQWDFFVIRRTATTCECRRNNTDVIFSNSFGNCGTLTGLFGSDDFRVLQDNTGSGGATSWWQGKGDEIAIWDVILSSGNEDDLWNSGNGVNYNDIFGGGGTTWPGYQSPFGFHRNKQFGSSFKEKLFSEQMKGALIIG